MTFYYNRKKMCSLYKNFKCSGKRPGQKSRLILLHRGNNEKSNLISDTVSSGERGVTFKEDVFEDGPCNT